MTVQKAPVAKRGRRGRKEGAEFRDRLIEAARELFTAEGFESVSIRKIAERAGCPPMTFYVYFKSKRALLRHIWEDVFAEVVPLCVAQADRFSDPGGRLRAFMGTMVSYWIERPDKYRIVFMNQDLIDAEDEVYYVAQEQANARFAIIERLIEDGKESGAFRDVDSVAAAQLMLITTVGVAHALITIPEHPWRRDEILAMSVDMFLRGLGR